MLTLKKTKRVHFNLLKAANRKNVRHDIGQHELVRETNKESSKKRPLYR